MALIGLGVIVLILAVAVEVAVIALKLTGLEIDKARFQALSASRVPASLPARLS